MSDRQPPQIQTPQTVVRTVSSQSMYMDTNSFDTSRVSFPSPLVTQAPDGFFSPGAIAAMTPDSSTKKSIFTQEQNLPYRTPGIDVGFYDIRFTLFKTERIWR